MASETVIERASLTPREVGDALDVTPATVRRWLAEGRLEGVRVGGRLRVAPEALEALVISAATESEETR